MARQPEQRNASCPPLPPVTKPQDNDVESRVSRVGSHLRGIYSDALHEEVPDIFKDLLRKLG